MKISTSRLRAAAALALIMSASTAHAQGSTSTELLGFFQWLVKAGAIGLAFFGLYLSYRLLANDNGQGRTVRSNVKSYVFLGVSLVASCIFLWAELHKGSIELFITPVSYDVGEAPKLSHNQKPLFVADWPHPLQCEGRGSLTVNLEGLVGALKAAKASSANQGDELKTAQAKTLVVVSQTKLEDQASVGFDVDAGEELQ